MKCGRCGFVSAMDLGKMAWCDYCNSKDVDTGYRVSEAQLSDAYHQYVGEPFVRNSIKYLPKVPEAMAAKITPYRDRTQY
jgi:hypothetical protein